MVKRPGVWHSPALALNQLDVAVDACMPPAIAFEATAGAQSVALASVWLSTGPCVAEFVVERDPVLAEALQALPVELDSLEIAGAPLDHQHSLLVVAEQRR